MLFRSQEIYRFDPTTSVVQVQVDTAGALGFMGHSHRIQGAIEGGNFAYFQQNPGKSSVELVVDAATLQVMDSQLSPKDRREIQATMQSEKVLGVQRYPKIAFKSVKVQPQDDKHLEIIGDLAIRGRTNQVAVQVTLDQVGPQLTARGTSHINQTTFGIQPVSAGLGTVRVKDQLTVSFQIVGQPKLEHGR